MSENQETKKPIYKQWWFWVIIVLVIAIVGGAGSQTHDTDTQQTSINQQATTNSTQQPEIETTETTETTKPTEKTEYNVGEEAILGDGAITVTNVEKSQGSQYDKPQSGKEFVIVSVTIENKGQDKLSYNPYYFKMQNSQGQQEDVTISTVNSDTALSSGELISGGKVSGTLIFEEPTGDTGLALIYNDNLWSSKELKINL